MTNGKQILEAPKGSKSRLSRAAAAGLALSATGMLVVAAAGREAVRGLSGHPAAGKVLFTP